MKKYLLFSLILACFTLNAQVTFVIDSLPDYTPPEDYIFFAGDINGWNGGDYNHRFQKNAQDKWEHSLDGFPDGITIEFKFTRGDWGKVEKGPNGEEIENRSFTFGNGDTVHVIIYNWADGGGGGNSTAAWNVQIMDENFYMPQLDRERRIWLYLPPGYDSTELDYPVLYMHDGQNLFDQYTAFLGEWEVDETLNELASQGYHVPIVVGIDNGGVYRIDELTPWFNPQYGGGQGDEYMAFIVETLKPYIDQHYRTLTDRENTGILGSSLGGLISTYGALKYPEVFSKSGPFSPAYWINNDSIWEFVAEHEMQLDIRIYQNAGELEEGSMVPMMWQMEDSLIVHGFNNVTSKVIAGGNHNEQTWSDDFAEAFLWLFASYANNIRENITVKPLYLFPNPAVHKLSMIYTDLESGDRIVIMDNNGRITIDKTVTNRTSEIDISSLKSGSYVMKLEKDKELYIGRFIKF